MTDVQSGLVPLLDEQTGRFPDEFAPPSVAADAVAAHDAAEAAERAQEAAEAAENNAAEHEREAGQIVEDATATIPGMISEQVTAQIDPKVAAATQAKNDAETARGAAQTARDDALQAKAQAVAAQDAAAGSAGAAATSAGAAAADAERAGAAAGSALIAANEAGESASLAASSASDAARRFVASRNLFNQADITPGQYVDWTNGALAPAGGNWASSFIPVKAATAYCLTHDSASRLAWYTSAQVYISGSNALADPIVSPTNAAYARFSNNYSIPAAAVQFEEGSTPTAYTRFGSTLADGEGINLARLANVYTAAQQDAATKVLVKYFSSVGQCLIHTPANAQGDKAFQWPLTKVVTPYSSGGLYQNANLWRIVGGKVGDLAGTVFTATDTLCGDGAFEMAIRISGSADFIGTYHGYEQMDTVLFIADGVPVDLGADNTAFTCSTFDVIYSARLIKQGTASDSPATVQRRYRWTREGLTLTQRINWTQAVPITTAFVSMLPIKRFAVDGDPSSKQLTDRAVTDYDGAVYDIGSDGHATPISSPVGGNVSYSRVWGVASGFSAEMTVTYPNRLAATQFMISNAPQYNKLYFSYSPGTTTAVGDVWDVTTAYRLSARG